MHMLMGISAYFVAPLTYGRWSVEKLGYRWSFIVGLYPFKASNDGAHISPDTTSISFVCERSRGNSLLAILAHTFISGSVHRELRYWFVRCHAHERPPPVYRWVRSEQSARDKNHSRRGLERDRSYTRNRGGRIHFLRRCEPDEQ